MFRTFLSLLALATLAGCVSTPAKFPTEHPVELTSTPFFPQRIHECGPAALATVLVSSGVDVTPDVLTDKVYLPGRRGSLQLELIAATRGYGRLAYPLPSSLDAITQNVAAGSPVLVLQNLALKQFPAWHYAVVIGFDPQRETVILRSGATERLEMPLKKFARTWRNAGEWAVVVLPPDQLPVDANASRYVQAAAGLEAAGQSAAALQAYRTALTRWPGNTTALLGEGNIHYRQRDLKAAEGSYRKLIEAQPQNAVARNNLAQVLLERGDPESALKEIQAARAALKDETFLSALSDTEAQIRQALKEK